MTNKEKIEFCKKQGRQTLWGSLEQINETLRTLLEHMDSGNKELEHEAVKAILRMNVHGHLGP